MIGKIITLPFWIVSKIAGILFGSVKLVLTLVFSVFGFFLSHIFGAIIGATAGFLLGRKHVGVKVFNHKKHHRFTLWNRSK